MRVTQKIYDISPPLSEKTAVWSNDTTLKRGVELSFNQGHHLELSSLTTTVHIGAHADAPLHYHRDGLDIATVDLDAYVGPCQLISLPKRKPLITPDDVLPQLTPDIQRVLVRTRSFPDAEHFNDDFTAFAPETIDALGERGVLLVGLDTPSVDPFSSKSMSAHLALHKWGMRNLEGLQFSEDLPDGVYELIALPLRLTGFDGSPLRAVLRVM